jgi:hypothetical protein
MIRKTLLLTMNTTTPGLDTTPMARIEFVHSSLRCFILSLAGLIPVAGIPFAVAAILQSRQVRKSVGPFWNPANFYLNAAIQVGPLGFLSTTGFLVVCCFLAQSMGSNCSGST